MPIINTFFKTSIKNNITALVACGTGFTGMGNSQVFNGSIGCVIFSIRLPML